MILFIISDQHTSWNFYGASPLKQQSVGRHVAPLRHGILFQSQPVFVLTPLCCVIGREAVNINLIVFGLTWQGLEPTIGLAQKIPQNYM
jgi:hypothetical protein